MKHFETLIALIGTIAIFIILFTPLIWVWIGLDLFLKVFMSLGIIFFACYIITKLINEID